VIAEFAISPSVFDEAAHPDKDEWVDQLRELGNGMLPKTAASPVMIANLCDGSWFHEIEKAIKTIGNPRAGRLCRELLPKIEQLLVKRPMDGDNWPDQSLDWCRQALATHRLLEIERIISCRGIQDQLQSEGHSVRCLSEVSTPNFWQGITSQWAQTLTIDSQVGAIRKIAQHAQFLMFINPYQFGESGGETDFTVEAIRRALNRPRGYNPVAIEIHTKGPESDGIGFEKSLENLVGNLRQRIEEILPNGMQVRLVHWRELLDRHLIAGDFTYSSSGVKRQRPRWGVHLGHVARKGDNDKDRPPTTWSLLMPHDLGKIHGRFSAFSNHLVLSDITVVGKQ
jgi:hypothetical protein